MKIQVVKSLENSCVVYGECVIVEVAITISFVVSTESTQPVLSEPQYTESDVYSEPSMSTEGRNRHTDTHIATSQPSTSFLLNSAPESQEYAQPHVTHTSGSIETARNPAYGCTQTSKPIETSRNPAYGCTLTSKPIETSRNPAYGCTQTSKPIETARNPAYDCTQPHVTETTCD